MEAEEQSMLALMQKFLTEISDCRVSPSSDDYHIRSTVIGNYSVKLEEVEGEVMNWSLQYLESRKCPSILTLAISKCATENLKKNIKSGTKFNGSEQNTRSEITVDAVSLHTETIRHLHYLCDCWREQPDQLIKHTADITEDPYFTSVCTIKNIRRKMEDRYTVIHNLNLVCGLKDAPLHSYYGVFDGHAGTRAANYAAAHLHSNIAHHPAFFSDPEVAIKEGFKITDKQILERSKKENTKSGCTVVCAFLNEAVLHVAWVGDSQAILVKQGIPYIITNPHKPDRQDERQRIEDLDGYVLFIGTWRVNGTLAVSRALGDPEHKPYVSAEPDVIAIPLEGNEDFFVLACDGLWDRLNPSDVALAIYSHIVEHPASDYDEVASRLVLQAKEHGSGDNITAIVVFLKDPKELAANPKNPPPYSLQLNGSKVDSWCQGSWNGTRENDNSNSAQYAYSEALTECAMKPNSLGGLSNSDDVDDIHHINYQFNPVTCEAGRSYENDESKNLCHSNMNSIMPEATAFSELPTPPIDELLAGQQFGEQDKLIEVNNTLSIVCKATEIKPSCVTLVDSGILEQDYVQIKQSDFTSQDIVIPFDSCNDHNDEFLSTDTAVEMASEIVNNAIELAVNQVMVRTSSQMSQHFDDSGLEEGPLEESDVSPVSASPEFDTKHASGLQELMSFNNEMPDFLKSKTTVKSEVFQNNNKGSEEERCKIQHVDLISEHNQFSEVELNNSQTPSTFAIEVNDIISLESEDNQNLTALNQHNGDKNDIDQFQFIAPKEVSVQQIIETHSQTNSDNLLLDFSVTENTTLNTSLPQIEPITSTPHQSREKIISSERINGKLDALDIVTCGNTESLSPIVNNSSLQPSNEITTTCISSLLPSGVGELFVQLADEENKALPTALSNSLSEELQSGIMPIDLVTIPDEVPEAEGVTEDSDSEKDGGWSYIQGGKTDLPKQKKSDPSVSAKTVNVTNKKPLNKSMKKEPAKTVLEARTSQVKPNTFLRKKVSIEKSDKDKIPSGTMKATKLPKAASVVEKTKKPSSAPPKTVSHVTKSIETISRPKSSVTSSGKLPASRTNITIAQKTAVTNLAMSKQQKQGEQRVTSSTQIITTNTTAKTTTTTTMRKIAPKPLPPTIPRVATKTATSQNEYTGLMTQSKSRTQPVKSIASTKLAPKSIQDVKQTKESTNKQISSQPSSVPKAKMLTLTKRSSIPQNPLPSRAQVITKPTTSKQPTGPPKLPQTKTQKPLSISRPGIKNRISTISGTKSTIKAAKDMPKPPEKPDDLRHHLSEQEKGTKEELTKEIVTEVVHVVEEFVSKQGNAQSHTTEAELENEAIQK